MQFPLSHLMYSYINRDLNTRHTGQQVQATKWRADDLFCKGQWAHRAQLTFETHFGVLLYMTLVKKDMGTNLFISKS